MKCTNQWNISRLVIIMKPGDIYKAPWREIPSYRQCIDNAKDYDKEYNRILNSVCHKLDLGPNMLLGAQQHTTVDSAAALSIQERYKGTNK